MCIVIDFCATVRKLGLHVFYTSWHESQQMQEIALSFEAVRGIPFVIGAIDGSHISIIAPRENPTDYYNRDGFHSILLQMAVMADCRVWDYGIGWAGSIHDSMLFTRSKIGQAFKQGHFGRYRLLGDCAYPARADKAGLTREKMNWNFVQSSS
ncbi:hypothetical protein L7F22_010284 [Adiantum nelumboides]|nr:hypothetical protein [Adiantum nelumboides]